MKLSLALLMVFSSGLFAREAAVIETRVGGHRLGETFVEWATINRLDLAEICGPHNKRDLRMDFKGVCKTLTALLDGAQGTFSTTKGTQDITWYFENAKVTGASMETSLFQSSAEEQIRLLAEVYGEPTEKHTTVWGNAFGAKWDAIDVEWSMPDGGSINAVECISNGSDGPQRDLIIGFTSSEKTESERLGKKNKPNPYR
jgi:hypothetical protein